MNCWFGACYKANLCWRNLIAKRICFKQTTPNAIRMPIMSTCYALEMSKCNHDYWTRTLFSRSQAFTAKNEIPEKRLFLKNFQCGPSHADAHDTVVTVWSVFIMFRWCCCQWWIFLSCIYIIFNFKNHQEGWIGNLLAGSFLRYLTLLITLFFC